MSSTATRNGTSHASSENAAPGLDAKVGRPRPPLLRALGASDPPAQIDVDGRSYTIVEELKHDSWAATARYRGPDGEIICKFNRMQSILGLPMKWLGRVLARREMSILRRFKELPNIPAPCGEVRVDDVVLDNAAARRFIPGAPLRRGQEVSSDFYPALQETLTAMHASGVAYVDLHKCENIIVGDDGKPYLIDFQISFALPKGWIGRTWPLRTVFQLLAESDVYHLRKHALGPKWFTMTRAQRAAAVERPWWIRLHRMVGVPFRRLRRALLVGMGVRRGRGRAETEYAPEQSVRLERATPPQTNLHRRAA